MAEPRVTSRGASSCLPAPEALRAASSLLAHCAPPSCPTPVPVQTPVIAATGTSAPGLNPPSPPPRAGGGEYLGPSQRFQILVFTNTSLSSSDSGNPGPLATDPNTESPYHHQKKGKNKASPPSLAATLGPSSPSAPTPVSQLRDSRLTDSTKFRPPSESWHKPPCSSPHSYPCCTLKHSP